MAYEVRDDYHGATLSGADIAGRWFVSVITGGRVRMVFSGDTWQEARAAAVAWIDEQSARVRGRFPRPKTTTRAA